MNAYLRSGVLTKEVQEDWKIEVLRVLKCILLSSSFDLTIEELLQDYVDLEGEPCPYRRFGYLSFTDFVQSMYEMFKIDRETKVVKLIDEWTLRKCSHILRMVATNNKDTDKARQRFICRAPQAFYTLKDSAPGTIPEVFCSKKDLDNRELFVQHPVQLHALRIVNKSKGLEVKRFEVEISKHLEQKIDFLYGSVDKLLARLDHIFFVRDKKIYPNLSCYSDDVKTFGLIPCNNTFVALVPLRTKLYLCDLMELNPHGVLWYDLCTLYQKTFGFKLDYALYGFSGIMQMIRSMPLFRCEIIEGEYHFFDARKPYPPGPQVTPGVLQRSLDMLALFPEGIDLEYFPKLYKLIYEELFRPEFMKFKNVKEALQSLEDKGVKVLSSDVGEFAVLDTAAQTVTRPIHPYLVPTCRYALDRDDVMGPSDIIPRFEFPDKLKVGMSVKVELVDCFGPHYFFAVLGIPDDPFDEMDNLMALYYKSHGEELQVAHNDLKLGLYCTGHFNETYQRALIVAFAAARTQILVLLIDFGSVVCLSKKQLFYLPKKFGILPAQCFLCDLNNILPIEGQGDFSHECYDHFAERAMGNHLIAKIHSMDQKIMTASITLYDLADGKMVDVSQELCEKQYAVAQECKKPIREPHWFSVWLLYARMFSS